MITVILVLLHSRSSDNTNDIIVNDFSSVKKTELNIERKILQLNIFAIEQVTSECTICDLVDITGLVYIAEHEKDGKTMRI